MSAKSQEFKSEYFNLGEVVCTRRVFDTISESRMFGDEVVTAMQKFCNKDWGELCEDDKMVNEEALQYPDDLYLLGKYHTCKGAIYIITARATEKAGDNYTTVCFPEER